jgi:polyferredoxin
MRRKRENLLTGIIILTLLGGFLFTNLPVYGGDFGSGDKFGSSEIEKNFNLPIAEQNIESSYFNHDQLIKLILLLVFMATATIIIRYSLSKYRKMILIASVVALGFYLGGFLCLTAIQNLFIKWQTGYLLLFLTVFISALIAGRVFCGYICPFGALQELLHLKRISLTIPPAWNRYLNKVKYVLLVYLLVRIIVTGQVTLLGYTPFKVLFAWGGTPLSIGLSIALAILSLIIYRPFCRYLCPLGAFLALISRLSLFKIRFNSNCVNCLLCQKACKSGAITGRPPRIDSSECILCGECLEKCPKKAIITGRTRER